MVLVALTGLGMLKFRRDLGQWTQYEAEAQHIRSWQSDWRLVDYQVVIEQQINIERSRRVSPRCPVPAGGTMNFIQLCMDFGRRVLAAESDDHVEEVVAVETICLASIYGRLLELAESFLQLNESKYEILPWVDIAADT